MKKNLLVFPAFFLCSFIGKADTPNPPEDIPIIKQRSSSTGGRHLPGAPALINACLMDTSLMLNFLVDMGEAEITVSADNSAWSVSETVNTAEGCVTVSVSSLPDDYTITIQTNEATYVGYYTICD